MRISLNPTRGLAETTNGAVFEFQLFQATKIYTQPNSPNELPQVLYSRSLIVWVNKMLNLIIKF